MASIPKRRQPQIPTPRADVLASVPTRTVGDLEPEPGYLAGEIRRLKRAPEPFKGSEQIPVLLEDGTAARGSSGSIAKMVRQEVNETLTSDAMQARMGGGGRHTFERSVARAPLETPQDTDQLLAVRDKKAITLNVVDIINTLTASEILTLVKTVDGAGSGLDADLLDGQSSAYYTDIVARLGYTPVNVTDYEDADVLAKVKNVDGAGSGLDSDLLDGQNGSFYLDRTNHTGSQAIGTITSLQATLDAKELAANKGVANGYASLGVDGKVPTSQLSLLALTDVFVVASQAAQLALTAEEGDVAVRTDLNKSFIHNGGTSGTMSDWQELLTPTDAVLSVNGQTGAVTLTTTHIAEGANLYFTDERVDDRVSALLQSGGALTWTYNDGAGTLTPSIANAVASGAAGHMSGTDKAKLDGIEAAADVTDAGNVGSSIHGASAKTTPVDADTLPLIDSAAGNILKKLTWANLKATLWASPSLTGTVAGPIGNWTTSGFNVGLAASVTAGTINVVDSGGDHNLSFQMGENLSATRTLIWNVGDTNRAITLSGDPTLGNWFDQSVKAAASPQFAGVELGHATDTTLTRPAAGRVAVEGEEVLSTKNLTAALSAAQQAQIRANAGFAGAVIDRAYGEYTTNADITTSIPLDDTIPQNTEGTQVLSVAITPKTTTNRVRATFRAWGTLSAVGTLIAALFRNSTADALAVTASVIHAADYIHQLVIVFEDAPGSTSAQTYNVRVGKSSAGNARLNGTSAARLFGGAARATLVLEEIAA